MDREKVIKGLEHCMIMCKGISHNPCDGCGYHGSYDCADKLKADALALLKEYDTQVQYRDDHIAEYEKEIKRLNKLLKEQENEEERILKIVWDVLHGCVSTDTVEDQDWVYEQIRNRVHPMY